MPNYDYHYKKKTITIVLLSRVSNITTHHETISISKTGLPVKIPNITALTNISFAIILTDILAN